MLRGPGAARSRGGSAGEVRIAVKAAGINFADTMARIGIYPDAPKPPCVVGYRSPAMSKAWAKGSRPQTSAIG